MNIVGVEHWETMALRRPVRLREFIIAQPGFTITIVPSTRPTTQPTTNHLPIQ
jgi:hypothetical protein